MTTLQGIQDTATAMGAGMMNQVFQLNITDAPAVVLDWIAAHPGQSALLAVDGVLIFTPAALTVPLLAQMGFGLSGPIGGK